VRGNTLEILNETMNPPLRVDLHKHVYVVGPHFQCHDFRFVLGCNLPQNLFAAFRNLGFERFASVLRTPNDMVLARIHDVIVRPVALHHVDSKSERAG
jgi:hypothetical protein